MANAKTKIDELTTWPGVHLYWGVEAMGIKKEGFRQPAIYKGQIGWQAMKMLAEHPKDYVVVPYLKPRQALPDGVAKIITLAFHKMNGFAHTDEEYNRQRLSLTAYVFTFLRTEGYDMDDLIARKMAIIHPDYDVTDIL